MEANSSIQLQSAKVPKHLSVAAIINRGWTRTAVDKFLGAPDKQVKNTYNKKMPIKLFEIERVISAEQTEQFQQWKSASIKRQDSAIKVAERKAAELLDIVSKVVIDIRLIPKEKLTDRAIKSWEGFQASRGDFQNWNSSDTSRLEVNYVRHKLTSYHDYLDFLFAKVGKSQAYVLLKNRVLAQIAIVYPHLNAECSAQML